MQSQISRKTPRPRILFVCLPDSTHSQSWMDLLRDSEFDVRVFASPVDYGDLFPPLTWQFPTYVLEQPAIVRAGAPVLWLWPKTGWRRPFANRIRYRFNLGHLWFLRRVVRTWKPDLVHTLRLNPEGVLTWQALAGLPAGQRPKWVVSSWGSDISMDTLNPRVGPQIREALGHCDGFFADCARDLGLAQALGLEPARLAATEAVPVTGGLNLADYQDSTAPRDRRLIVVPKAFESPSSKGLAVLEALRLAESSLAGYEIHLLMCDDSARWWLGQMPESLQQRCRRHGRLPQPEVLALMKRARVMIAPSIVDGTPNVMLEAMAAGALPLMSPLEPIQEWIEDGRNGLLAHALYPDQIAIALRRAMSDDALVESAGVINRQLVERRANRAVIRPQVLNYYRSLVCRQTGPASEW